MEIEKKVFTFYDAVYNKRFQKETEIVRFNKKLVLGGDESVFTDDEWDELEKLMWRYIILNNSDEQLSNLFSYWEKELGKDKLEIDECIKIMEDKTKMEDDKINLEDALVSEQEFSVIPGQTYLIDASQYDIDFLVNSLNLIIYWSESFLQYILFVPVLAGWKDTKWYAINENNRVKELQKTFDIEIRKPTKLQLKLLEVLELPLKIKDYE